MEHGNGFLIFLGGVAIGGIGAWLGLNTYYKDKYSKELENRWDALKAESKKKDICNVKEESKKEDSPIKKVEFYSVPDISVKRTSEYKALARDYSAYYTRPKSNDTDYEQSEEYDLDQAAAEQEHPVDDGYRPPYEIDSNEAGYGLDLNTVTFYTVDNVLADDLTNEKLDIDNCIGDDGVKIRLDSDEDAVYIRNETLGIDYEVLISHTSYAKFMEECNGFTD